MQQLDLTGMKYGVRKKQTRRKKFLMEMEQVVPFSKFVEIIRTYYYQDKVAKGGGQPKQLASVIGVYLLQNWYKMSDPSMEDALYQIASMRNFARISLDQIPDETTILNFRHLLEEHGLTTEIFRATKDHLIIQGIILKGGTMLDASIIHALSSTKNGSRSRDPEMSLTKKGNQYHFGMKVHIGADVKSKAVDSVSVTAANVHDSEDYSNGLEMMIVCYLEIVPIPITK